MWGPSIYDIHTEGEAQVDACGRGGVKPHVVVDTEN